MQAYRNYIIHSEIEFNKSFTTESGLELQADARFSADRLSNRLAFIKEVPVNDKSGVLKKGFQVMIDPTIFYRQNYVVGGTMETTFMLDRMKGLYTIQPEMIVLFRENEDEEWKGFGENILVLMNKEIVPAVKVGGIFISEEKTVISKTLAKVIYSNELLKNEGVENDDSIYIKSGFGVSFWIEGKEYSWINNRHVLAKIN